MTTYLLRTDDGREWTLPAGNVRSVRIAAFNILFREDIAKGVVWAQRAHRKNGEVPRWVISMGCAAFTDQSSADTDPWTWKRIAHRLTFSVFDSDELVIDRELFDEQSIEYILHEIYEDRFDEDSRRLGLVRYTLEPNDFSDNGCWMLEESEGGGAFPVWMYDMKGEASA